MITTALFRFLPFLIFFTSFSNAQESYHIKTLIKQAEQHTEIQLEKLLKAHQTSDQSISPIVQINFNKILKDAESEAKTDPPVYLPALSMEKQPHLNEDLLRYAKITIVSNTPLDKKKAFSIEESIKKVFPQISQPVIFYAQKTKPMSFFNNISFTTLSIFTLSLSLLLVLLILNNKSFLKKSKENQAAIKPDTSMLINGLIGHIKENPSSIRSTAELNDSDDLKGLKCLRPYLEIEFDIEDLYGKDLVLKSQAESYYFNSEEFFKWLHDFSQRVSAKSQNKTLGLIGHSIEAELETLMLKLDHDSSIEIYKSLPNEQTKKAFLRCASSDVFRATLPFVESSLLQSSLKTDRSDQESLKHLLNLFKNHIHKKERWSA